MRKRPKITEHRFDQWTEDLREWIKKSVSPFEDDTPEKQAERIGRGSEDRLYFFQTYLPHYFYAEPEEFQREWDDLADVHDEPVPVAAPREHAKSTFFSFGVPVHDVSYALKHFIMIISDSNDQATGFTLPIRIELEENPRLKHDFGDMHGRKWRDSDFVTSNGVRVLARGRGEKVRGLKNLQYRPDRVIIDDLENDKNVMNPKIVKEALDWLLQAVLGSLADGYSMLMVGNLFAPRSVLNQMLTMTDEETGERLYPCGKVYDCWVDYGKPEQRPLWPGLWPAERLGKRRRQMGTVRFNKEMRNLVGAEDSPIRENWIVYVPAVEIMVRKEWQIASFLDPSAKSASVNDFKAIITVGKNPENQVMDVVHAWIRHATVNEMWKMVWEIDEEFVCGMGVEINMFQDFLIDSYEHHAKMFGRYLRLSKVHHATDKIARIINRLSGPIEFGRLRFSKGNSDQDRLVEQLIYIMDANVHDDGPDALEGAVSMVQGTGIAACAGSVPEKKESMTGRRTIGLLGRAGGVFGRFGRGKLRETRDEARERAA